MTRTDETLKIVRDALEPLSLPVLPLGEGDWLEGDWLEGGWLEGGWLEGGDDPVPVGRRVICFAGLSKAKRENIAPWTGLA